MGTVILLFYSCFQNFFATAMVLSLLFVVFFVPMILQIPFSWLAFGIYLLVVGAFVHSLITRYEYFHRYIHQHGVVGEMIISQYRGTGNYVNEVEVVEAVGFLKLQDGKIVNLTFASDPVPQYPVISHFVMRPNTPYRVLYMAHSPHHFVIDQGTAEQAQTQMDCAQMRNDLQLLTSKLMLDPQNAELLQQKQELESRITENCGS